MSTYAIGDAHGCLPELKELLEAIAFNPNHDKLWFTGDIIGTGVHSLETLRFVKSLNDSAILVLGNHEIFLLYLQYHHKLLENFSLLKPILNAPDSSELLFWLRHLPLLHHDSNLGFVIVHAGILPIWTLKEAKTYANEVEFALQNNSFDFLNNVEGTKPDSWDENLTGCLRLRFITNVFTRMRFCDAKSRLNLTCSTELGKQPPGYMPWFKVPDRKNKDVKIIFGHWAALLGNTASEPSVYGLDTGCVYGNKLTALRLDDEKIFSVKKHVV